MDEKKRATFVNAPVQAEEPEEVKLPNEREEVPTPMDSEIARIEHEEKNRRRAVEGEYRARNRARTLLSMEVTRMASPSERLKIILPEGYPWGFRWCDEEYRNKKGMDIWVAVHPDEFDEIKQFLNLDQVRVEDGQIRAGKMFLAKAPREKLEQRNALHYQRSQRAMQQAAMGQSALMKREGNRAVPAGLTLSEIEASANRGRSKPLVRFTGTLDDDDPKEY